MISAPRRAPVAPSCLHHEYVLMHKEGIQPQNTTSVDLNSNIVGKVIEGIFSTELCCLSLYLIEKSMKVVVRFKETSESGTLLSYSLGFRVYI